MRRKLKCSFCGRNADQVGRLLAGPKVHICDGCVRSCNTILESVPNSFSTSWDDMNDEQLLAALRPCAATVESVRAVLCEQVDNLRLRGVSWEAIGSELGISRQAAWERFS